MLTRTLLPALAALVPAACALGAPGERGTPAEGARLSVLVDPRPAATGDSVRVATLAEAVAWLERNGGLEDQDGGAVEREIRLAPGVHEIRRGVRIGKELGPLTIRGEGPGARLVGGIVRAHPAWRAPEAEILARVPAEARAALRALELSPEELAGWAGGLAGPVHSGHGVEVAAIESELFVGGVALTCARWPNTGFAAVDGVLDAGSVPRQAEDDIPLAERVVEPARGGTFLLADHARLARWAGEREAWALGYWNWDWSDEQLPIATVDPEAGSVTLGLPHRYGLAPRARFHVTNVLAELDAPGECWIDRGRGVVYAWLAPGTEELPCALSLLGEPMLTIEGAHGVVLEDLVFECTRGPAVEARDVTALIVERSTFRNLGTRALAIDGRDCAVRACSFEDVGGSGVELTGGERETLTPGSNAIEDCVFRRCARRLRTYHPAIRLDGVGQRVAHCELAELPHLALLFAGNEHVIEANEFHHVVLETGDAGAVYVGRDWTSQGTVLRGNVFHSIQGSAARYQNAVYLDDMASGITVEGNLFVRCNWGVLAGGGRDDTIRGNAFVACGRALSYDARGVGWMAGALADPSTSTLHRRYAAMPVLSEPWRSRYPALARYLEDRPGRPVGGRVRDNLLVGTPLGTIEDRECVEERGSVVLELAPAELEARGAEWLAAVRRGTLRIGEETPVPVTLGPVGPRRAVGAP